MGDIEDCKVEGKQMRDLGVRSQKEAFDPLHLGDDDSAPVGELVNGPECGQLAQPSLTCYYGRAIGTEAGPIETWEGHAADMYAVGVMIGAYAA